MCTLCSLGPNDSTLLQHLNKGDCYRLHSEDIYMFASSGNRQRLSHPSFINSSRAFVVSRYPSLSATATSHPPEVPLAFPYVALRAGYATNDRSAGN